MTFETTLISGAVTIHPRSIYQMTIDRNFKLKTQCESMASSSILSLANSSDTSRTLKHTNAPEV
jgi:hypothetical protein